MSAREELEHYLTFSGHGPQKRKALIDAFAHELAEQQRAWAREHGVMLEDERYVTAGDVIDHIDPYERPVGSEEKI